MVASSEIYQHRQRYVQCVSDLRKAVQCGVNFSALQLLNSLPVFTNCPGQVRLAPPLLCSEFYNPLSYQFLEFILGHITNFQFACEKDVIL